MTSEIKWTDEDQAHAIQSAKESLRQFLEERHHGIYEDPLRNALDILRDDLIAWTKS